MANTNSKNRGYNPAKLPAKAGNAAAAFTAVINAISPLVPTGTVIKAGYRAGKVYATGSRVTTATAFTVNAAVSSLTVPPPLVGVKVRAGKPGRVTVTLPPAAAVNAAAALAANNAAAVTAARNAAAAAGKPYLTGTAVLNGGSYTAAAGKGASKPAARRRRRGRGR